MKINTKKLVLASMLSALCCVATMIIKIPSPMKGYLNLGDAVVLLCGWILSPWYAFFSAGIGSALADVFSGYVTYAPATFIIKGIMAIIVCLINKKKTSITAKIIGGIIAEIVMIMGYFLFEGFLYGFAPSLVNIPANAVQGVAGIIIGIILIKIFEKAKIH